MTKAQHSLYQAGRHAALLEQEFDKMQTAYRAGQLDHTYARTAGIAFWELGEARADAIDAGCEDLADRLSNDYLLGLDTLNKAIMDATPKVPSTQEMLGAR